MNEIIETTQKVVKNYEDFMKKFHCKKYSFSEKFYLTRRFEGKAIEVKVYFSEITFDIVSQIKNDKLLYSYIVQREDNSEISLEQLNWFLTTTEVQNFLKLQIAEGSFIPRLKNQVFETLEIPISKVSFSKRNLKEVDFQIFNSYKLLLSKYFREYKKCFKDKNFMACTSLSGSICELILFQLLTEQKSVAKSTIHEKGLGTLILYAKMLELDLVYKFDMKPFEKINKIRNKIIHPSNTIKQDIENIETIINPIVLDENLNRIFINFGIN